MRVPWFVLIVASAMILFAFPEVFADEREKTRHFLELARKFDQERKDPGGTRTDTILEIGKLQLKQATKFLADKMRKEDPEDQGVLMAYVTALGKDGGEIAVQTALTIGFDLLEERNYGTIGTSFGGVTNSDAIDWLTKKGWKSLPNLSTAAQIEFMRVLHGTGDPRVVRPAYKLLGNKNCPELQADFVRMVARMGEKKHAKKIRKLYSWNDPDLMVEVLLALRKLEASAHSDLFEKALKSRYWKVRAVAVDIVGGTGQLELVEWLGPLLKDENLEVQVSTVRALKKLGGVEAFEFLVDALPEASGRTADDIGDALVWLSGKDFGIDPIGWSEWWKANHADAEIKGIGQAEFDRIKKEEEDSTTGVYYGLRLLSKYMCFIVDVSGSMEERYNVLDQDESSDKGKSGTTSVNKRKNKKKKKGWKEKSKIQVAREELIRAIASIPDGTKFNIIKFSGMYKTWQDSLVRMNDRTRSEAIAYAKDLGAGGTTNVYDTLAHAMADSEVNTIYLLSDGAPTAGLYQDTPSILKEVERLNQARNIKIHTIGFHLSPQAESLMRALAEANFGRFVKR